MKKFNSMFLSTIAVAIISENVLAAVPSTITNPSGPTSSTSTSGFFNSGPTPASTNIFGSSPYISPGPTQAFQGSSGVSALTVRPQDQQQPSSNPSTVNMICVDSGIAGRRCGVEAVNFCRLNPDALNCHTLNDEVNITK